MAAQDEADRRLTDAKSKGFFHGISLLVAWSKRYGQEPVRGKNQRAVREASGGQGLELDEWKGETIPRQRE